MNGNTLLVIASLGLLMFAGCADVPIEPTIEPPRFGATFTYEASDGTELDVIVEGRNRSLDASGGFRDTWTLRFLVSHAKDPEDVVEVVEAVDPASGLTVNQLLLCVYNSMPDTSQVRCDSYLAEFFFAGAGLPGALGMAPLWGRSVEGSAAEGVEVAAPYQRLDRLDVHVTPDGTDCRWMRYARPGENTSVLEAGSWVATTVLFEPFLHCDGVPLPVAWRPSTMFVPGLTDPPRPHFVLRSWSDGDGERAPMADGRSPTWARFVDALPSSQQPLVPPEGGMSEFPSSEAFAFAREQDSRFSEMVSAGSPVIWNEYRPGGGFRWPLIDQASSTSYRSLGVQANNGSMYVVEMKRVRDSIQGMDDVSHEITGREWTDHPQIAEAALAEPLADPRQVHDFATERLHGKRIALSWYGFKSQFLDAQQPMLWQGHRSDGPELMLTMFPDGQEGPYLKALRTVVDGATGTLVRLEVPKSGISDWYGEPADDAPGANL